jgi:ketosteroid isomerase-like protein
MARHFGRRTHDRIGLTLEKIGTSPMTPAETMATIVDLRQQGRMDEAAAYFEEDAVLVIQSNVRAVGRDAVKDGLEAMSKAFPVFRIWERVVVEAGDVALHHSNWSAASVGEDGLPHTVGGVTSDVLRRQADGQWRVAIDNPWGGAILADTKKIER